MLSRRNAWLLIALPLALGLLWVVLNRPDPEPEAQPQTLTLSGQLLYLAPISGSANLHAYDPQSDQTQTLTEGRQINAFHPSADGRFIYFAAANQKLGADIWQLTIADLSARVLIECGGQSCDNPQSSPDGRHLAYTRLDESSGLPQVWLYEFATGSDRLVSAARQIALAPRWSPAGPLSFYNQSVDAYEVLSLDSDQPQRYPNALGEDLAWLPDGFGFIAAEAFAADSAILRGTTGEASLQTPEPGSQSTLEITVTALLRYGAGQPASLFDYGQEHIEDAAPATSPDGRWLAFTRKYLDEERWTPGRQLWIHEFETGATLPLTASATHQMSAISWHADSSLLAFVRSNRTDFNQPTEIWIMQPNGSNAQLIAVDAFAPQWLP